MEEGIWKLEGATILLEANGRVYKPTASQICAAEFKDLKNIAGINIPGPPSRFLPRIRITRLLGNLSVSLAMPVAGGQRPCLEIAVRSGRKMFPLHAIPVGENVISEGTWIPLDRSEVAEVDTALRVHGISGPGSIPLGAALGLVRDAHPFVRVTSLQEDDARNPVPLPETGLRATLYPYQETGVSWLDFMAREGLGCILADEMGLGKTLQIIALLSLGKQRGEGPSLVVCPATLLENWRREFSRFMPSMKTLVHAGPHRTGFPKNLAAVDVVICSYDTLVQDCSLFGMIQWGFLVLDEAQAIKNPETRRSVAVREIPRMHAVAVTGTPVENRLRDLWSIMEFANPGFLGSLDSFEKAFEDTTEDAVCVGKLVTPLILRRRVEDVGEDLPERVIVAQPVPMDEHLIPAYEKIRQDVISQYEQNASLVALLKLRQFCAHPMLVAGEFRNPENYSKYHRLLELAEEIADTGQKGLIFTSFRSMADMIVDSLSSWRGMRAWFLDGRVPVQHRQELVDSFSAHHGPSFLVLNPRAAGTGLNIVAANHVIHYTPEWNPAVEDQATARAYRRGQRMRVIVHRLFVPSTVEEVMNDRLEAKRNIAENAVLGTDGLQHDAADIARAMSLTPWSIEGNSA